MATMMSMTRIVSFGIFISAVAKSDDEWECILEFE